MRAGQLRNQITIETLTVAASDFDDESEEDWTTLSTPWASLEPVPANEYQYAQAMTEGVTHRCTIRDDGSGVAAQDRVTWDGRTFYVHSIINLMEREKTIQLLLKERM
jgi:SPP1 family predicted phage head-tail adaptor